MVQHKKSLRSQILASSWYDDFEICKNKNRPIIEESLRSQILASPNYLVPGELFVFHKVFRYFTKLRRNRKMCYAKLLRSQILAPLRYDDFLDCNSKDRPDVEESLRSQILAFPKNLEQKNHFSPSKYGKIIPSYTKKKQ